MLFSTCSHARVLHKLCEAVSADVCMLLYSSLMLCFFFNSFFSKSSGAFFVMDVLRSADLEEFARGWLRAWLERKVQMAWKRGMADRVGSPQTCSTTTRQSTTKYVALFGAQSRRGGWRTLVSMVCGRRKRPSAEGGVCCVLMLTAFFTRGDDRL